MRLVNILSPSFGMGPTMLLHAESTETVTFVQVEAIVVIQAFVTRMILMDVQVLNCIMECFV